MAVNFLVATLEARRKCMRCFKIPPESYLQPRILYLVRHVSRIMLFSYVQGPEFYFSCILSQAVIREYIPLKQGLHQAREDLESMNQVPPGSKWSKGSGCQLCSHPDRDQRMQDSRRKNPRKKDYLITWCLQMYREKSHCSDEDSVNDFRTGPQKTEQGNKETEPVTAQKAKVATEMSSKPNMWLGCKHYLPSYITHTHTHTQNYDFTKSCDISIIRKIEEEEAYLRGRKRTVGRSPFSMVESR